MCTVEVTSLLDEAPKYPKEESLTSVIFHLTSDALLNLRKDGYIKSLPQITEEQINDRSKSDIFTKLITTVQVFSVIVQVVVRRSRNLATSQLELAVTAFSVCAIVIYLLMLYHPKGVQTTEILYNDDRKDLSFEEAYKTCIVSRFKTTFGDTRDTSYFLHGGFDEGIPNDYTPDEFHLASGIFLGGTIFGAVHCFGWFFVFPTEQEQLLWRIASLFTTGAPIFLLGFIWLSKDWRGWIYSAVALVTSVIMFFYIIARLFIIVEVFRSLFYLPPDTFISTWVDNIPHVS